MSDIKFWPWCIFNFSNNPLFAMRSRLNHTGVDNTLAPVFSPDRQSDTLAILRGSAGPLQAPDTRARLAKWPIIRQEVKDNLDAIVRDFDPFAQERELTEKYLPVELRPLLAAVGRKDLNAWLGLQPWKATVERSLAAFDDALEQARTGAVPIERLRSLHRELVEAYSGRGFFNLGGWS
jgi:hypothetical protein